jgi:hypothetical protein
MKKILLVLVLLFFVGCAMLPSKNSTTNLVADYTTFEVPNKSQQDLFIKAETWIKTSDVKQIGQNKFYPQEGYIISRRKIIVETDEGFNIEVGVIATIQCAKEKTALKVDMTDCQMVTRRGEIIPCMTQYLTPKTMRTVQQKANDALQNFKQYMMEK